MKGYTYRAPHDLPRRARSVGGYVIFDDVMSHRAVMACWIDFKTDQGLPETLTRIDKHSAYFQKIADTRIDPTKQHPPQDVNVNKK